VHSVEVASHRLGFTETFVGVFVIAIIGNAAEHSTAVWMAAKDKMDLAIGIAVESSKQIALFVGPLLVLLSLVFREDQMTLEFTLVEVLAVVVCTIILKFTCDDGESNWLEGVQLLALYLILGVIFFFTP
jgi:Ca2+:H+ antiporter